MFDFISANLPTILVSAVLVLIVAAVIAGMIRDKKKGTSSCGGNCAGCSGSCCHGNVQNSD